MYQLCILFDKHGLAANCSFLINLLMALPLRVYDICIKYELASYQPVFLANFGGVLAILAVVSIKVLCMCVHMCMCKTNVLPYNAIYNNLPRSGVLGI